MKVKLVRRPQTLSPFGVGAIYDVEGESFVAADIACWKYQGEEIREPRLEQLLGVNKFKMGPAAPDNPWAANANTPGVPYFRFPQWLFCPTCRTITRWSVSKETGDAPYCTLCPRRPRLVPMRFVMACPRGHLADVPWERWAHSGREGVRCDNPRLRFVTYPGGSGLEFVAVRCETCRSERSLAGIATPYSLERLGVRCPGRQPWQRTDDRESCDGIPQVLQRGATNLTFASIESSIDIPPYSNWASYNDENLQVTTRPEFTVIMSAPNSPVVPMLVQLIADALQIDRGRVQAIVDAELRSQGQPTAAASSPESRTRDGLLAAEYQAFLAADRAGDPRDRFVKRRVPLTAYLRRLDPGPYADAVSWLGSRLDTLVQVTRLREVRVLTGFSRLAPTMVERDDGEAPGMFRLYSGQSIPPTLVPADLGRLGAVEKWLPAIEVYGEGIFLSLDETELQRWEQQPEVQKRVAPLVQRRDNAFSYLPDPTARTVLLHTLAHILIRQLSFECGYSIASLRERIYAGSADEGSPMAGILIYTAAGDAEGTLGGLVREGAADRLLPTILKALQNAEWCSSDPLCRESTGQGPGTLNLAACHACALLPETSCTMSNRLLDRGVVLGSMENPGLGFFGPLVEQLVTAMGAERWSS